jgi:hypothetical protein
MSVPTVPAVGSHRCGCASRSTPQRVGQLAADRAIPVFESVTETADLEEIFFQLTASHPFKALP